jgi:transmembrane sensor
MTKVVNIPPRDRAEIEAQARTWLVRLDGLPPGAGELREFREWLARSPLHRESFEDAARTWGDMDVLSRWLDTRAEPDVRVRRPPPMFRRAIFVAAGVMAIAVLAAWLALPAGWHRQPRYSEHFATSIGEVRTVTLPDGSRVQLNTGTRIAATIDGRARLIRLDAGEAWFQVAHNPQVPFVVYAGHVVVQAVGTAFNVRLEDDGVDLTVTEGRVELASMAQPVPADGELQLHPIEDAVSRVPLEQGQLAVVNGGIELVRRLALPEIERTLSWRDGMLVFDNDRLEDVVAEINRYTPQKIVISDSELRDLRFGGYFRLDDVSSIMATFEADFGIRVARINDNVVYLSRRRGGG